MTAKLVDKIVFNKTFCRLCFCDVGDEDLRFLDEVILNLKVKTIAEMLTYTLGGTYAINMSVHDIFCSNCVELLKNSYNFIQMCKNNSERLIKTVDLLNDCFENTAQNIKSSSSVLIQIDTRDYTYMQFYQYRKTARNLPASLDLGRSKYSIGNKIVSKAKIQDIANQELGKLAIRNITDGNTYKKVLGVKDKIMWHRPQVNNALKLLENKLKLRASCYNSIAGSRKHILKMNVKRNIQQNIVTKPEDQNEQDIESQLEVQNEKNIENQQYVQNEQDEQYQKDAISEQDIQIKKRREGLRECILKSFEKSESDEEERPRIRILRTKPKQKATNQTKQKTQQREYKCDHCGKLYKGRSGIVTHMGTKHMNVKPLQCDYCDMIFHTRQHHSEHVRREHLEPSVKCDLCGARYRSVRTVYKHRSLHYDPKSTLYLPKLFSPSSSV